MQQIYIPQFKYKSYIMITNIYNTTHQYYNIYTYPRTQVHMVDNNDDYNDDDDAVILEPVYRRHTNFANDAIHLPPIYIAIAPFEQTVEQCAVCIEVPNTDNTCKLNCDHVFCCSCISTLIARYSIIAQNSRLCPLCRTAITRIDIQKDTDYLHPTI